LAYLDINNPNVVSNAAAMAQALIVTQSREPYFDDTARDLVSTIILHLVATKGRDATLPQLRTMVTDIAARGKAAAKLLIEMGKSPHTFIRQPIGRFKDAEARDISSAINTAITQTFFLDDPAFADASTNGALTGNDFDLRQLKKKPTTIYVILPGHLMTTYSRFLRLLLTSAIERVTSEPGGHPVLLLMDEFAQLENLPAVMSAFSYAAGFNLQLWPFVQDLAQLEHTYGKRWKSILANCGMVQFFTPADIETAEYLQRRGGMTTGETLSRNYGGTLFKMERSESRSESRMPLLPIEKTMSLPPNESVVFFAGKHDPLIANREPYWTIPRLAKRFDPDPYHLKA
jgi:type IV secretion system protein VirD4